MNSSNSTSTKSFKPTVSGTVLILIACLISYLFSFQDLPSSEVARYVSISWLIGIGGSFLLDWRLGLRNLIRVDVFALLALYFFLYFEFLFVQTRFDMLSIPGDVIKSIHLTLIGLAALVLGRHISLGGRQLAFIGTIEMQKRDFLVIYFLSFVLWGLPMWLAVEFDPFLWIDELTQPRFSQAWGRGKFGDLSSLLHELRLLGYVLPPIAGVIFARRREYGKGTVILVLCALLILWFVAFCGGTRNVLGIQMAGFLAGFLIVQERLKLRTVLLSGFTVAFCFVVFANMMLEFRNMGLERYITEGYYKPEAKKFRDQYIGDIYEEQESSGYFVDYNLLRISQLVAVFPNTYNYLGWNLPYVALTKPIPRAFWPGKPMDLKVGMEEAIGAKGMTIAATWVGEAYVAGGYAWVAAFGLIIGVFCRFWNQLAVYIQSPFPLIVFASGFFAVLLLMRSLMFFTTSLLPSIALIAFGIIIYHNRRQ